MFFLFIFLLMILTMSLRFWIASNKCNLDIVEILYTNHFLNRKYVKGKWRFLKTWAYYISITFLIFIHNSLFLEEEKEGIICGSVLEYWNFLFFFAINFWWGCTKYRMESASYNTGIQYLRIKYNIKYHRITKYLYIIENTRYKI